MRHTTRIILKSGKDQSLMRYHPWVFSGAIKKMDGTPAEGDLVKVFSNKDEFLGIGHYQVGTIAVRILSFKDEEINEDFWFKRMEAAYRLRFEAGLTDSDITNAYRLVNAEGDGFPGLIIDFYNGTAVMQMHSIGMYLVKEQLCSALKKIYGNRLQAIYNKSEHTLPFKAEVKSTDDYEFGNNQPTTIRENNNLFEINWERGQKTGFFLDQRENRKLLGSYSRDKKVLNMFGYTGGFSVYALQAGASLVHSVDSSQHAIDMTRRNVELNNNKGMHEAFAKDAFEFLNNTTTEYDIIILDPPAFAKHQNVLSNALQGYKKLNRAGIEKVKPGGLVFTFSCSQVVSKSDFRKTVFTAAANTGRNVKILHQLNQPCDHPVSIYHPEGEYLKGLVLSVE